MPKLQVVPGRKAVRALERAGFEFDRQVGSHVTLLHTETGVRVTVPVHGSRDLKRGTLRSIVRQAGLSLDQFRDLLK